MSSSISRRLSYNQFHLIARTVSGKSSNRDMPTCAASKEKLCIYQSCSGLKVDALDRRSEYEPAKTAAAVMDCKCEITAHPPADIPSPCAWVDCRLWRGLCVEQQVERMNNNALNRAPDDNRQCPDAILFERSETCPSACSRCRVQRQQPLSCRGRSQKRRSADRWKASLCSSGTTRTEQYL